MLKNNISENVIGTVGCVLLVIFIAAVVPWKIVNTADHGIIEQISSLKNIGPILILGGILGYILCFWNFIFNAKGTPLPGFTQDALMVNGLYKYVRNPMYVSLYLIISGEILFFSSLDLVFYFFAIVFFFHFKVVLLEEPWLKEKFGPTYAEYCSSVNRWVPRLNA